MDEEEQERESRRRKLPSGYGTSYLPTSESGS